MNRYLARYFWDGPLTCFLVRLQAGRVAAGRKPAELVANILCGFEAAHEVQHAGNKQFAGFVAQALIPHVPHGHTASSLAWTGS